MNHVKLQPCFVPACGTEIRPVIIGNDVTGHEVRCARCEASVTGIHRQTAINLWNSVLRQDAVDAAYLKGHEECVAMIERTL